MEGYPGCVALFDSGKPGKTIALRFDIDCVNVTETRSPEHIPNKEGFASINDGFMHACGHDFHMTIALGSLERALEKQPKNNLLFLFQPAEENEAGGMLMYEDDAFGDWLPDQFYGLHVRPDLKVGQIATNTHTLFAGTCEVKIHFKGKGGHAAFPHQANDALVQLAILSLKFSQSLAVMSILSRELSSLSVSFKLEQQIM